jgi:MipA family protein
MDYFLRMTMKRLIHIIVMLCTLWFPFFTNVFADDLLQDQSKGRELYIRIFGGYGTDETLIRILQGNIWLDDERTGILGFQAGTPLAKRVGNTSWDLLANAAIVRHLERDLQSDFNEYTLGLQAYFDGFPWQQYLRTRFGIATGLSYAEQIPAMERESLEEKGSNTSHLLLHADVSLDFNLGDIFRTKKLDACYFGFSVWHRSGLFGELAIFNNVDGGYNWLSLELECIYRL